MSKRDGADSRPQFWEEYDIVGCTNFISNRGFKHVTLQFPDDMLSKAPLVARAVLEECKARGHQPQVSVLGDTSYNPEGVDEVAAAHVNADSVIHFGRASLSRLTRLPAYFVFGRAALDVAQVVDRVCSAAVQAASGTNPPAALVLLPDQPYVHAVPALQDALSHALSSQAHAAVPVMVADVPNRSLEPGAPGGGPQPDPLAESIRDRDPKAASEAGLQPGPVAETLRDPVAGSPVAGDCTSSQQLQATLQERCQVARPSQASAVPAESPVGDHSGPLAGREHMAELTEVSEIMQARVDTVLEDIACLCTGAPGGDRELQSQEHDEATPLDHRDPGDHIKAMEGASRGSPGAPYNVEPSWEAGGPVRDQELSKEGHGVLGHQAHGDAGPAGTSTWATWRSSVGALVWQLPAGIPISDCVLFWLGPDDVAVREQLQMTLRPRKWVRYDPTSGTLAEGVPRQVEQTLRRRAFLLEKARTANIVGIVVGTLGVAGYLEAVEKVRQLARAAGKRTYTVLMGKPSPAKLANFPEIDVFVMVADPQGQILDSREFYSPVITPYEAQLAFSGRDWDGTSYHLGFEPLLEDHQCGGEGAAAAEVPHFSLLDGSLYGGTVGLEGEPTTALTVVNQQSNGITVCEGALADVRSAADYLLLRRTFQGLTPKVP
eukprot:jgi/Botrbrau1/5451/Bobra.27_1s0004.3